MSKNDPRGADPVKAPETEEANEAASAGREPDDQELIEAHREAFHVPEDKQAEDFDPAELRAQLEEANDRALRSQAELENYRKRVARQMNEERRYANMGLIRDLLPVWDNMGRAIEAAESSHETGSLLEGFKMTARQLENVLERHHCMKIEALHQPFDPNLHEAISQQPSQEHPAGTVLLVTQVGFLLHDRVVRPSQVVVAAAVPAADDREGPEQEEEEEEAGRAN